MDELSLLKKIDRIKAPPDFEQKVLAQLYQRKGKIQGRKHLRLSLAGAFSALLILFVLLNVFILSKKGPVEFSDLEKGVSSTFQRGENLRQRETIPIIEAMDYTGEIRSLSQKSQTIYILEQVSDTTTAEIKY